MNKVSTLKIIAMSEDGDWFAFPADWTKKQVASEIVHNLMDWWLDDYTWIDEDDKTRGWITGYRELLLGIKPGWVRYEPTSTGMDWWWETEESHPSAEPAWIFKVGD